MILTERDKKLLLMVQSYGCLTTRQIAMRIFPGVRLTTVLRRLRALESEKLIQKILGLESMERLWAVTSLATERHLTGAAKLHFPRFILEHDSNLTSLRLRLEDAGVAQSWIPEHEIRSSVARRHGLRESKRRVIPDGIMGVEMKGLKESVAVELELSPKNQGRYKQIFRDYSEKRNLWAVWYVSQSRSLLDQIIKAKKSSLVYGGPKLLISHLDFVLKDPLNAKISDGQSVWRFADLWTIRGQNPAHPGAHRVSTVTQKNSNSEGGLSVPNEGKTLTPTG